MSKFAIAHQHAMLRTSVIFLVKCVRQLEHHALQRVHREDGIQFGTNDVMKDRFHWNLLPRQLPVHSMLFERNARNGRDCDHSGSRLLFVSRAR